MNRRTHRSPGASIGRIAIAMLLATVIGGLPVKAAYADGAGRDDRARNDREHRDDHRPPPRHHRYPVYVPPAAYYPQQESPGIRLVFPIVIH
jgi:hypothetical protein